VGFDAKSAAVGGAAAAVAVAGLMFAFSGRTQTAPVYEQTETSKAASKAASDAAARRQQGVTLSQSQGAHVKVAPVEEHEFANQRDAIGNIDFNEDRSVQVFTSYQGKIRNVYAKIGDDVPKGKPLFDIESPDLVQAESTLISAAGTRKLTTRALERAHQLFEIQGIAQKDLDQATSDQQAAEAAYKAARDAVAIFGKSPADMDRIVEQRHIDPILTVVSPIAGRITARSAQPGLLLQPGNGTAPFTVSDISTMWMQAFVPEADSPLLHMGQKVQIKVNAFPGRMFTGIVTTVGSTVDANTHRVLVRSEIQDPKHELRPGMFTSFAIRTGEPTRSPAIAPNGIAREGDGTMTVWVTTDRKQFVPRTVKLGLEQDGLVQIVDGIKPGEMVASEGALFLSSVAATASQ
jgi:cobalt-zinc-cadmium efflux system membrane fusion protein